ncbi:cytochrome C oxidase subunit IV family protein [Opitutales bacterium]|jgi:caa(3)-type oxidase subunit IV|nr:cytochrome C oxidase subunit IV family protein [Opitutales bacterium]
MSNSEEHHGHSAKHYVKIYWILLAMLGVSIVGPEIGIKWLTLITAFGIALVKAWMVCAYFMHLNIEKKIAWYTLAATLLLLLVFFTGVAPDVMKPEGQNWKSLYHEQTREEWDAEYDAAHHGDDHGDDHGDGGH